jgi:hypothetical protein
VQQWENAFLVTLLIEVPLVSLFLNGIPLRTRILAALLANGISHPLLWILMPRGEPFYLALALGEICVIGLEVILYRWCVGRWTSLRRILMVAIGVNTISCGCGLLWEFYWGK